MIRIFLLMLIASVGYADRIRVAVASSMQKPLKEIAGAFNESHEDCEVQIIVGSSGKLTAQIMNGAPYDLFFSADMAYPEYLEQNGMTAAPVYSFAQGLLAIWAPRIENISLSTFTNDRVRRIAIANPRQAPYGRAAVEIMKFIGIFDEVTDKLVYAENVAQVVHYVKSGGADVGFVAVSNLPDIDLDGFMRTCLVLDLHAPIQHGLAALTDPVGNKCLAAFLSFVKNQESITIFKRYGFELSINDKNTES